MASLDRLRGVAAVAILLVLSAPSAAAPASTPWVEGHGSRARLIAGTVASGAQSPRLFAGIQLGMAQGWKTYWRTPGDSGGFPPHFDWSGSANLETVKVLYPAPHRFKDAAGDSVGYTGSVLFPVEIRAKDPAKPVELHLSLDYGICREICVPAQAKLTLPIPAGGGAVSSPEITSALAEVPRASAEARPQDPKLGLAKADLGGKKPRLVLEAVFPASAASGDMFIEAPDGIYLPLPKRVAHQDDKVRFEIDLTEAEPDALRGKTLLVTMVSDAGQSEASWTIE